MKLPSHGSNPEHLLNALRIVPKNNLIDFSVNVTPLGPPPSVKQEWENLFCYITDYPDPSSDELKQAISEHDHLAPEKLFIGNGAAELIYLIAHTLQHQNLLIVDPTFSEYRDACLACNCNVHSFLLREDQNWELDANSLIEQLDGMQAVFICHPNNPTGVTYSHSQLIEVIKAALQLNVIVIIDEAFFDFCEQPVTLAPYVERFSNLVILRSFTKMFAIAGIRLGYMVAHESLLSKFKRYQPQWSVNVIAEKIGTVCLNEKSHIKNTMLYVKRERDRVFTSLRKMNFHVTNSKVNYYLLREESKQTIDPLFKYLLEQGIIPRHTFNFKGLEGNYLRFSLRTKSENDVLLNALEKWRAK